MTAGAGGGVTGTGGGDVGGAALGCGAGVGGTGCPLGRGAGDLGLFGDGFCGFGTDDGAFEPPWKITSTGIGGAGSASFRACLAATMNSSSRPTCSRMDAEAAHPVRVRVVGTRSRVSGEAASAGVNPRGTGAASHAAKLRRRDTRKELGWGHRRGAFYQPHPRPGRGYTPRPARVTGVSSPNLARFSHRDGGDVFLSATATASHLFLCELGQKIEGLLLQRRCATHNNSGPAHAARIWRRSVLPARFGRHNHTDPSRCACPAGSFPR